jgi:hypothetical protein
MPGKFIAATPWASSWRNRFFLCTASKTRQILMDKLKEQGITKSIIGTHESTEI